jgi:hypothetical protein
MRKLFVGAALIAAIALTGAAEAKGCLKGAAVGGIAGHYAHHHAILGAVVGCAVGHHEAVKNEKLQKAAAVQKAPPATSH